MTLEQAAESPTGPAFGVPPQRTPVEFDPESNGLRIGPYERRIDDPSQPEQVYGAYLSLLYAVRGVQPGEQLKLRTADLEALLLIVGDDPDTIEQRLIGLMGCTAEEAKVLGGALLRHRRLTATLGIAASLALGGAIAVDGDRSGDAPRQDVAQSVAATPGDAAASTSATDALAADAPASAATDYSSPTTTSVLLAGLAPPAQPASAAAGGSETSGPAAAAATTEAVQPAAAAAAAADPVAVVSQAPSGGAQDVDAPPPAVDPLEGAIEIGDTVNPGEGSSFAAPSPTDTVVETPVVVNPVVDAVAPAPEAPAAPAAGQEAPGGSASGALPPQVPVTLDDTRGSDQAQDGAGDESPAQDTVIIPIDSTPPAGGAVTGDDTTPPAGDDTTPPAGDDTTPPVGDGGTTPDPGNTNGDLDDAGPGNGGAPKAHDNRDGELRGNNGGAEHGGAKNDKD